jgi:hypothetical protein
MNGKKEQHTTQKQKTKEERGVWKATSDEQPF